MFSQLNNGELVSKAFKFTAILNIYAIYAISVQVCIKVKAVKAQSNTTRKHDTTCRN